MEIILIVLLTAFVLRVIYWFFLVDRRNRELRNKLKIAEMEKDIFRQIIRESNIKGVPPKDLADPREMEK